MVTGLVPYFAVIPPMDRIIEAIEAEIQRLHAARTLLAGETIARKVGKPGPGKRSAPGGAVEVGIDEAILAFDVHHDIGSLLASVRVRGMWSLTQSAQSVDNQTSGPISRRCRRNVSRIDQRQIAYCRSFDGSARYATNLTLIKHMQEKKREHRAALQASPVLHASWRADSAWGWASSHPEQVPIYMVRGDVTVLMESIVEPVIITGVEIEGAASVGNFHNFQLTPNQPERRRIWVDFPDKAPEGIESGNGYCGGLTVQLSEIVSQALVPWHFLTLELTSRLPGVHRDART
jgi:hypothetical protein